MSVPQTPFAVPFGRQLRSTGSIRGTMLSAVLHLSLLAVIIWAGRTTFENADNAPGEGRGRGGGGGGGGNRTFAVWTVPAAAQTPPAPVPPPVVAPAVTPTAIPEPQPETQPTTPAPAAPTQGQGEGPGAGPGTGPGAGTGTGGGTGSGTGPGTGPDSGEGGGGRIFPPSLQGMIIPPPGAPRNVRGTEVTVTFRISERGEVLDVEVDPPIRDRGYRNEFLDRMRRYTFTPAYTRDGRPIASEYQVKFTIS